MLITTNFYLGGTWWRYCIYQKGGEEQVVNEHIIVILVLFPLYIRFFVSNILFYPACMHAHSGNPVGGIPRKVFVDPLLS